MEAWKVDHKARKESVEIPTELEFARRLKEAKKTYDSKPYLTSPKHLDSLEAYKVWWCKRNNVCL